MNTQTQQVKPPKHIDVRDIRIVKSGGGLKGFVSIQIGPLIINDCRIIQANANQAAFVSPPQREFTNRAGERQFFPLCQWPREWGEAISEAVISVWHDHPEGIRAVAPSGRGQRAGNAPRTSVGREVYNRAGLSGGSAQ